MMSRELGFLSASGQEGFPVSQGSNMTALPEGVVTWKVAWPSQVRRLPRMRNIRAPVRLRNLPLKLRGYRFDAKNLFPVHSTLTGTPTPTATPKPKGLRSEDLSYILARGVQRACGIG